MPQSVSMSLKHRMQYLIERQGVVSGNVANSATPGYLAKDISFEKMVNTQGIKMASTNGNHLSGKSISSNHKMSEDTKHIRHDGNSVKMDEEMLKLQDIQMNFRLATQLYKKQVSFQKLAIGRNQ
jgi:flagellar basal-body rod protein FlgB